MECQITSERLLIRPRTQDDIQACIVMDRDPMVTKFIDGPWHNPEQHKAFLVEKMMTVYPYPFGYWSIAQIEKPDEFLGWVMILPLVQSLSKVEIGWRLTAKSWGRGIATEATKRVIKLALETMPKLVFVASIHPENSASIKVAKRIGMSFDHEELIEGVLEHFYILDASVRV